MGLTLVTPATAPDLLADAKTWCAVDDSARDAMIESMIAAAVADAENYTGMAIGEQEWRLCLDAFADEIELIRGPVLAVSAVRYIDAAGDEQTVDPSSYTLDAISTPARIVRNSDAAWPATGDVVNAVMIDFSAGYDPIPAPIKTAIMMMVVQMFDNRMPGPMPEGARDRLFPYRRLII